MGGCVSTAAAADPAPPLITPPLGGKAAPASPVKLLTAVAQPAAPVAQPAASAARGAPAVGDGAGTAACRAAPQHGTAAGVSGIAGGSAGGSASGTAGGGPAAILKPDESERLRALRALNILGSREDPRFVSITSLMKQMFGTAVATITMIDDDALNFMAQQGEWGCSVGRAGSFCDWTLVEEAPTVLIVEDAAADPRFKDNPYVCGEPHIRFYAGAPLVSTLNGHRYGTLCVFDFAPRSFNSSQYGMLAHFAEIVVREMERGLALERQQQEMSRAHATRSHLLRAMDCFHEGIILLDLSSTSWQLVYANDAFRATVGMPHLLLEPGAAAAAGAASGGQGGDAAALALAAPAGAGPGGPTVGGTTPDFWSLFEHVAAGSESSYHAALTAMVAGKEFKINVRAVEAKRPPLLLGGGSAATAAGAAAAAAAAATPSSSSSDSGADSGSSGGSSSRQRVLTILFRPADNEQLRAGMPHIGVPAGTYNTSDDGIGSPGGIPGGAVIGGGRGTSSGSARRVPTSPAQAASRPGGAVQGAARGGGGKGRLLYYFGIVQADTAEEQQEQGGKQQQQAKARRPGSGSSRQPSMDGVVLSHSETSAGSTQVSAVLVPSFYQLRPSVMEEVTLGPLIGTGTTGRCYRGLWQGGRVAVKIIDCWLAPEAPLPPPPAASAAAADHVVPDGVAGSALTSGGTSPPETPPSSSSPLRAALVEAVLARSLSHPHIVATFCHGTIVEQVPNSGRTHQQTWMVQEYCNRGALMDAIDRGALRLQRGGAAGPNLPSIMLAAQEIAGALPYLHSHGVVHGDLTPTNVLLTGSTKDARCWTCKVGDFGLVSPSEVAKDMQGSSFGGVAHMAPELLAAGELSKAADVFSFGVILLEMYYGQRAWVGSSHLHILTEVCAGRLPFAIPPDVPPRLASLLRRCLHQDPAQRPTFPAILSEVAGILHALPGGGSGGSNSTSASLDLPGSPADPRLPQQQQHLQTPPAASGAATPVGASVTSPSSAPLAAYPFSLASVSLLGSPLIGAASPFAGLAASGRQPSAAMSPFAAERQPSTAVSAFAAERQPSTAVSPFAAELQPSTAVSPFALQQPGTAVSPVAAERQPSTAVSPFAAEQQPGTAVSPFAAERQPSTAVSPFAAEKQPGTAVSPFAAERQPSTAVSPFAAEQQPGTAVSPFAAERQPSTAVSPFSLQQPGTAVSPFAAEQQPGTAVSPFAAEQQPSTAVSSFSEQHQQPHAAVSPFAAGQHQQQATPAASPFAAEAQGLGVREQLPSPASGMHTA